MASTLRQTGLLAILVSIGLMMLRSESARAQVIVFDNRVDRPVEYLIQSPTNSGQMQRLAGGDVQSIAWPGQAEIRFHSGARQQRYLLAPNAIYQFTESAGEVRFARITLAEQTSPSVIVRPASPVDSASEANGGGMISMRARQSEEVTQADPIPSDKLGIIPVTIYVDDDEPAVQRIWEARLRRRFELTSDLFEQHCRVRFEVVATGTWQSDNSLTEFTDSYAEFAKQVTPMSGTLAIGFTSQHHLIRSDAHLGGTKGPLCSHILIRESSREFSETERLQVLVHELGHVLGAIHSPDSQSIMRPTLSDRRARAASHRIHFDPLNTLAMCLICDELRRGPVNHLHEIRDETKLQLQRVYSSLAGTVPGDHSAEGYLARLAKPGEMRVSGQVSHSQIAATRAIVRALCRAAESNAAESDGSVAGRTNDQLTEYLIESAAGTSGDLPEEVAGAAFLLALGIGLNPEAAMIDQPAWVKLAAQIETDEERTRRHASLGTPTMHGRTDLTQHFTVSAGITSLMGPNAALAIGIAKELSDAQGGSGFSAADLSADMAGIAFATAVLRSPESLPQIANQFRVIHYIPSPEGLPEGLSADQLQATYGSVNDQRFKKLLAEITSRIQALPGYKSAPSL